MTFAFLFQCPSDDEGDAMDERNEVLIATEKDESVVEDNDNKEDSLHVPGDDASPPHTNTSKTAGMRYMQYRVNC